MLQMQLLSNQERNPSMKPKSKKQEPKKPQRDYWKIVDKPGKYMQLAKEDLKIDPDYQRTEISDHRVRRIAAEWSWVACGILRIARRADGSYWVMDGQHRLLGALRRDDITKLPCVVFASEKKGEARSWHKTNKDRGNPSALQLFKADITGEMPDVLAVQGMVEEQGYVVKNTTAAFTVRCVNALLRAYKISPELTQAVWELCVQIHEGRQIDGGVFNGLFHLERYLRTRKNPNGLSICKGENAAKLISMGSEVVAAEVRRRAAISGKGGGARLAADTIVQLLNKRRKKGGSRMLPQIYA